MKGWPKGFPHGEYKKCIDAAARNKLRAKFGMTVLRPYKQRIEQPKAVALLEAAGGGRRPSAATHPDGRWPRTNEGAIQFIKDWNGCVSGEQFKKKFDLDRAGFLACSGRASSLRAGREGFKLVMKKHVIDGMRILYDWKLLAKVAEETAAV